MRLRVQTLRPSRTVQRCLLVCIFSLATLAALAAEPATKQLTGEDALLADYFRAETAALAGRCLADIHSLKEWEAKRGECRRQLQEMLGLWPMPERTPLDPVITGKLEQDDFTVEKLYFQALPKLYVTANLYLPKKLEKPVPAILYVCGHLKVLTNGVSCGNKAGYQYHGAWFARNGYVCLLIDTLQLGEIQGDHRGTHQEGQWWWNARGYTPAGVEAWFGIRALDYLCSRPEVDKERIGMTGRSGGGSYTWTVAALDDRVKVAAPVAGITDLQNQVVDGAVDGHCDCMFFVNTYRWDFPQVAALLAPRPLLLGNSDKDRLFPLDGVVRLYEKTRRIYDLYGARANLGLLITEGPHADTQDLQVPVFRWFNRFLKGEQPLIEMAAKKFFPPEQLRVFDRLPEDEINTKIQEQFVPEAKLFSWAKDPAERQQQQAKCLEALRGKVFAAWPAKSPAESVWRWQSPTENMGLRCQVCVLSPQPGVSLSLYLIQNAKTPKPEKILLTILDSESWTNSPACNLWLTNKTVELPQVIQQDLRDGKTALAFFAPRGVRPAKWMASAKTVTQVRRRYMLLGQTLDAMRVWDIRCAASALTGLAECKDAPLCLRAKGQMGVNAAYAALFEPAIQHLELEALPASHQQGPDYLNVLRVWDIPQVLGSLGERVHITE